jgi:hypothetical protein
MLEAQRRAEDIDTTLDSIKQAESTFTGPNKGSSETRRGTVDISNIRILKIKCPELKRINFKNLH